MQSKRSEYFVLTCLTLALGAVLYKTTTPAQATSRHIASDESEKSEVKVVIPQNKAAALQPIHTTAPISITQKKAIGPQKSRTPASQ